MATHAGQTESLATTRSSRRVDLAHEPQLTVGPLSIDPGVRRIAHGDGREEIVEPRVMQVLVALLQARGAILSRDELIERCWSGRIVGEDAITRVMSRLRRLADGLGQGVFGIETLNKVGYRLVTEASVTAASPVEPAPTADAAGLAADHALGWRGAIGRRSVLGGALALGAALVPIGWSQFNQSGWRPFGGHVPNVEARRFYDAGMQAQYFGVTDTSDQALAYFRQATAIDPEWADAWGSLAMAYRHILDGETGAAQVRLAEETQAASRRALALDPDNAEALVALILLRSPFRRWEDAERAYRGLLERFPAAFVLSGHHSRLLQDLGRTSEASDTARTASTENPLVSLASFSFSRALYNAGRLHEAEAEIDRSVRNWPRHPAIWFNKMTFLIYTRRTDEAIAFASNAQARPQNIPDFVFERRILEARAVGSMAPADIAAANAAFGQMIQRSLAQEPRVVPADNLLGYYATIGDLDTAFALLDGYYFQRGPFGVAGRASVGPFTRRSTSILFAQNSRTIRADGRFAPLLQELELEDYWRAAGVQPDFRRSG